MTPARNWSTLEAERAEAAGSVDAALHGDLRAAAQPPRRRRGRPRRRTASCTGCHLALSSADLEQMNKLGARRSTRRANSAGASSFPRELLILWFAACAVMGAWTVLRDPTFDYRLVALGALASRTDRRAARSSRRSPTRLCSRSARWSSSCSSPPTGAAVRRHLIALPIGFLAHLVLDGVWADKALFWWPAFGDWGATAPRSGCVDRDRPRSLRTRRPGAAQCVASGSPTASVAASSCGPADSRRVDPRSSWPHRSERASTCCSAAWTSLSTTLGERQAEAIGVAARPRRPRRRRSASSPARSVAPERRRWPSRPSTA